MSIDHDASNPIVYTKDTFTVFSIKLTLGKLPPFWCPLDLPPFPPHLLWPSTKDRTIHFQVRFLLQLHLHELLYWGYCVLELKPINKNDIYQALNRKTKLNSNVSCFKLRTYPLFAPMNTNVCFQVIVSAGLKGTLKALPWFYSLLDLW